MIAILAGNHNEARDWVRINISGVNTRRFKYIRHMEDWQGIEVSGYIIVGSFFDRKDAKEIYAGTVGRIRTSEQVYQ
jgi:hypothetical protein